VPKRYLLLVICLAVGAVCVRLGVWQLDRRAQRRALNAIAAAQLAARPVDVASLADTGPSLRYQRVLIDGVLQFDTELALGPRPRNGSPGVHVVTPLARAGTDTLIPVVRGWVYAADASTIDFAKWRERDTVQVTGYAMPLDANALAAPPAASARTVRRLHRSDLATRFGKPVTGYYVVMTAGGDTGISVPVRLAEPALTDGPHLSYAVQWFLFATIFGAGGTVVVLRGRKQSGHPPGESR
jgi:surfeit locus 1 family protein